MSSTLDITPFNVLTTAQPHLTCNVIDRQTGKPAVGLQVMLRCLQPRSDVSVFRAYTDKDGWIHIWPGRNTFKITFWHYFFSTQCLSKSYWQIGFFLQDFYAPATATCTLAEIDLILQREECPPHITLFADTNGYATSISCPSSLLGYFKSIRAPSDTAYPPSQTHGLMSDSIEKQNYSQPVAPSRKKTQALSATQHERLLAYYVDTPYPSKAAYHAISKDLLLSQQQAIRWFKATRAMAQGKKSVTKRPVPDPASPENITWAENNGEHMF